MAKIKKRIVVLASGRGSNFEAIANAIQQGPLSHLEVVSLISNRLEAKALQTAKDFGIPTFVLESKKYKKAGMFLRTEYEKELKQLLLYLNPDWICLAGYLLLLGREIVDEFPGKILNIHPSLLPQFKGLNAQRQALQAGESKTGCTVHLVTADLDAGPIILQKTVPILPYDTEESLSQRLLPIEHEAYVEALKKLTS